MIELKQPNLSPVPEHNLYCLLDDYEFKYNDIKIVVPEYYMFNGASIPAIAWQITFTPFHPDVIAPALIHDWCYTNEQVDRETADKIFYDMLILNNADKIKAKAMHKAVRTFGASSYGMNDKKQKAMNLLYLLIRKNDNFDDYCFPG